MNIDLNNGKVFCTKCGAANKAGYRFCVKCGAKLMIPVAKPQPYDAQETTVIDWAQPVEEPKQSEPPTLGAFEQAFPAEEPVKEEPEPAKAEIEPVKEEPEPAKQTAVFAHSEFSGTTTPTAAAGAFATAVDAAKNNKQIDVSDAETVMSLLEQGESSALAKGLPEWDIVPPQVVVRRKHRV